MIAYNIVFGFDGKMKSNLKRSKSLGNFINELEIISKVNIDNYKDDNLHVYNNFRTIFLLILEKQKKEIKNLRL